jgi:hypothetical protein
MEVHDQSFNERALLLREAMILWHQDKGPATPFAAVIVFAGMNVPVSFYHCDPHGGQASLGAIMLSPASPLLNFCSWPRVA